MQRTGLLFESSDGRSCFLVTAGRRLLLGRRPPVAPDHVRLPSRIASSQHALVTGDAAGAVTVEDAASTSGTWLDDHRVGGPTPIGPGAVLRLADVTYTTRAFSGESLWDRLRRGPLEVAEALAMARQVLVALVALHRGDHGHGALTPHEILRADGGAVVVLTHGWTVLTDDGALMGNPIYVAPECLDTGQLGAKADIYALGLILFEAMAGRRPFASASPINDLMARLHGGAPTWEPRWSPALRDWLLGLLARFPAERPSALRALERLEELGPRPWP